MRFGILTDIHEDVVSLGYAMDIFSQRKCDELVCLGDILGYDSDFHQKNIVRNASECISIIQKNFKYVVTGNHDLYAMKKIPKQLNGFIFPPNWYELSISQRKELSNGVIWLYENEELINPLTEAEFNYLYSLPEYLVVDCYSFKILFSHSIFPDITGSNFFRLHNPWELLNHFSFMQSNKISYGFSGHMHTKNLISATQKKLKQLPYKKSSFIEVPTQFLCPPIVQGKEKSGLIIVDTDNFEIEAIRINNNFKFKMFTIYSRKGNYEK